MTAGFLEEPPITPQAQQLFDEDVEESGYVWNVSRLWAYQPETLEHLFELMSQAFKPSGLDFRQRGILVAAAASTLGDSYCSLAWGGKLSGASSPTVAAGVLDGTDAELTDQEKALASWARQVVKDPNATDPPMSRGFGTPASPTVRSSPSPLSSRSEWHSPPSTTLLEPAPTTSS
jgi:alkylhydroperoxidase family enzyme